MLAEADRYSPDDDQGTAAHSLLATHPSPHGGDTFCSDHITEHSMTVNGAVQALVFAHPACVLREPLLSRNPPDVLLEGTLLL